MSAKCSSCGAAIVWAKTTKGKRMPVDAEPAAGGNINLDGFGVARYVPAGKGHYKSHFATCPNSAAHRKGRS